MILVQVSTLFWSLFTHSSSGIASAYFGLQFKFKSTPSFSTSFSSRSRSRFPALLRVPATYDSCVASATSMIPFMISSFHVQVSVISVSSSIPGYHTALYEFGFFFHLRVSAFKISAQWIFQLGGCGLGLLRLARSGPLCLHSQPCPHVVLY